LRHAPRLRASSARRRSTPHKSRSTIRAVCLRDEGAVENGVDLWPAAVRSLGHGDHGDTRRPSHPRARERRARPCAPRPPSGCDSAAARTSVSPSSGEECGR
jgi:hypothetical protein